MKRLMLINDFESGGGAEQVFLQTQRLLSDRLVVRTFVGSKRHIKAENMLSHICSTNGRRSSLSRIYSIRNYKSLLGVLSDFKPDIVHLHNYHSALSPSILKAIRVYRSWGNKIKVVLTAHDFHLLCPFSMFVYYPLFSTKPCKIESLPEMSEIFFLKWDHRGFPFSFAKKLQWIYAYLINDLDREIDHIIAPGEFLASFFKEKYSLIPVSVVRNPFINMNAAHSDKANPENKNNRTLKIIFTGRLSPEKGLIEFIGCLGKINSVCYEFKIIGDGPQKKEILKEIQRYNLQERMTLTGAMEHHLVLEELRRADALILPSRCYENAPLTLVEGAFMNLRLITANYGGMKEMAELCGGQYLMDPEDFHSVEKALTDCYNDTIRGKPLKGRDIRMLSSLFSEETYIDKLLGIYDN